MSEGRGKQIVTNVFWKFAERILAQAVSLVVSIVLARLLLPEDYGAISMVMVFITLANVFVTEGIPSALIQKKDADRLDFSSVFYFNLGLSVGIYALIYLCAGPIANFYHTPILSPVLKVLGLRIIVASVNSVQHAYVSRNMMFKKYFWSTLFGTLLSGVVGIWMAYRGFGVWALVAQYMTNTTVDTIVLFVTVNWRPRLELSMTRVLGLLRFGWKMLFEGVAANVSGQLRNLIIGKVYTSSDLAYYTKAQQFPSLIVTNICVSISSVLFPAMSKEQNNPETVLELLRKSVRISSYAVYPMLVGLAAVSTPFVRLVLTDKWIDTVPYLIVFCFLNMATVGMIPRHQALNGTGRSDVFMKEHIVSRLISLGLLLLVYRISILAIVLSSIAGTVILSLIIAYTSRRYNGYRYRDQLRDIAPTLLGCLIMGVPVYCLGLLPMSTALTLTVQVVVGIGIYAGYSHVFKLEEYRFCLTYLNQLKAKVNGRS